MGTRSDPRRPRTTAAGAMISVVALSCMQTLDSSVMSPVRRHMPLDYGAARLCSKARYLWIRPAAQQIVKRNEEPPGQRIPGYPHYFGHFVRVGDRLLPRKVDGLYPHRKI